MAFIEKCCEVCGQHVGYSRKGYLTCDNSIQVCPTCRPLFRGAKHSFRWVAEKRRDDVTDFVLSTPEIQGNVSGEFSRWSYDKSDTIKKLRRLLRVKRLTMGEAA